LLNRRTVIEAIYRAESRRVFATLVRLLGDFDRGLVRARQNAATKPRVCHWAASISRASPFI